MVKFDLHTHHERCGHAVGTIEDYVKSAVDRGLKVIGISDHSPFFASEEDREKPRIAMAKSEFHIYVEEVLRLKEAYESKIEVLLGVESDFFEDHVKLYSDVFAQYPFDYIIGSVHVSNGTSIFDRTRWEGISEEDVLKEKEHYLQLIQKSARSRAFDILGHIDAMKGYYPAYSDHKTQEVERTMKVLGEEGATIEINTSGKNKDCGGWYPDDDILELAHHYGVGVTFGSDAHVADRVGDEFDEVKKRLKEIGFTEWTCFRNRKPFSVEF